MSVNIQIGNGEVVNLLVVERCAELELEIKAKKEERKTLLTQQTALRKELVESIESDIKSRYLAQFQKIMESLCEFHDEYADWEIAFNLISLAKPSGTVGIHVALFEDEDGEYVDVNGSEVSEQFQTAVDGLQLVVGYNVPEAQRVIYVQFEDKIIAASSYIQEREKLIADRDDMASKMLAAFTAKTLAANPEHYANVLSAVRDVAGGQLFLGSSPIGVTVDGSVVDESEDQTSGD